MHNKLKSAKIHDLKKTIGDDPRLQKTNIESIILPQKNKSPKREQQRGSSTPRKKDLQNLVEDLRDYKATQDFEKAGHQIYHVSDSDVSEDNSSIEGAKTWQKFDHRNVNKIDLFHYEGSGEAEHERADGELDHGDIDLEAGDEKEMYDDPRGPGFEDRYISTEQKCSTLWKCIVFLILICLSAGVTVFLLTRNNYGHETKIQDTFNRGDQLYSESKKKQENVKEPQVKYKVGDRVRVRNSENDDWIVEGTVESMNPTKVRIPLYRDGFGYASEWKFVELPPKCGIGNLNPNSEGGKFHGDHKRENCFWRYPKHKRLLTFLHDTYLPAGEFCTNCKQVKSRSKYADEGVEEYQCLGHTIERLINNSLLLKDQNV